MLLRSNMPPKKEFLVLFLLSTPSSLHYSNSTFFLLFLTATCWHFNNGPVRLERGGVQLLRITQVLLMALTDKKWIQAPILTRPYDL